MELDFNPFNDYGITNYEQFKLYPFLIFGTLDNIKNRINQQIKQIKNGYYFGDRLIIIGDRGIGKTSSLFFIKDMLGEADIRVEIFSRLIEDAQHFEVLTGDLLYEASKKPIYLLIDFPDTLETKSFKKFLNFLWELMTHPNYNKINLIFTMNKSHYEKSFAFSEILGKFTTLRLDKLNLTETEQLISSRLKKVKLELDDIFSPDILELIFSYAKGIPRNIVSACSLLVENSNGEGITKENSEKILKEEFIDQVINDRVEDLELRKIYKQMTIILEKYFNGVADSRGKYVSKVKEITNLGRNSILSRIDELIKFGILTQYKGGYNRVQKIISFS